MSVEDLIALARAFVADHANRVLEEVVGPDGQRHTMRKVSGRPEFISMVRGMMIEGGMVRADEFQFVDQRDLGDFRSLAFLEMIFESELRNIRAKVEWFKEAESPHLIRAYPAIEWHPAAGHAKSCRAIWKSAGGTFHGTAARMIAPKFDPIWAEISAFGVPWSTDRIDEKWRAASVSDVPRSQLEDLGLIYEPRGWVADSIKALDDRERANTAFSAAVASMDPEMKRKLLAELRGGPRPRDAEEAGRQAAAAARRGRPNAQPVEDEPLTCSISPPWEWGWTGEPIQPEDFRCLSPLFPRISACH